MTAMTAVDPKLHKGFAYVDDPRIIVDLAYLGSDNFIGRPIAGYNSNVCIYTEAGKDALIAAQDALDAMNKGYVLKIFDSYRPTTAVADFERWAQDPHDNKMQKTYYPDLQKPDLFKLHYISNKSAHSRGCAVDLTIAIVDPNDPNQHTELEMGTRFDFFGDLSHTDNTAVPLQAQKNRQLLRMVMHTCGFQNLPQEWWHYNLVDEPFPDTYFSFPVE